MTIPTAYEHQTVTSDFIKNNETTFVSSDPGTGKTRSVLDAYNKNEGRMLVLAPLSILQASWGSDCEQFRPDLSYSVAFAKNREKAFKEGNDIVLTNHDAIKWLFDKEELLADFTWLVVDESTAFKNRTSQRSKALNKLKRHFNKRVLMTGTPNSNTILDIWHQIYILDDGKRLGPFFGFRNAVCAPKQVGPNPNMVQWLDKNGAEESVADLIRDINIRYRFNDCLDIPEHTTRRINVDLPKKVRNAYELLAKEALLELEASTITAVHAGVLSQKLLQLTSGTIYDEDGEAQLIHKDRYELVIELVTRRKHSLVAYNWKHQVVELERLAIKNKISYAIINGETNATDRGQIVNDYQAGKYQVLFAHPQSAGHGLTLTKGTTTIWASPTYNAEYYQQFNKRIHRAGQTEKTETIQICADNTLETHVYEKLSGKLERMSNLLDLLHKL